MQSIGLKRSRPLSQFGNVSTTFINESPIVIYLANMHTRKSAMSLYWCFRILDAIKMFIYIGELLNTHAGEREGRIKPKRRFSLRESSNKSTRGYVTVFTN